MSGGYVLILGAKSDISKALAYKYAENGYSIYLAARNSGELAKDVTDIEIRYGVKVSAVEFDALDYASHESFFKNLEPAPVGVICVVGCLPEQEVAQKDFATAKRIMETNYIGCVSVLETVARDFEEKKKGFIVGISSVAGDRGRKKNYIYGSARAGFSAYLSGLRNRLFGSNVQVLTVKPGFVATRTVSHMDFPERITGTPRDVAADIFRAQQNGMEVIYTRWYWKAIMWVIIHLPEKIFKRLNI